MTITVRWKDEDKTCIETRFDDPWSPDEFLDARKTWHRMIKSVDYRVPVLMDLSDSFHPPMGVLRHFSAINRSPHSRQGHIYVLGLNPAYLKLGNHLFDGAADPDKAVRFVDSVDDIE